MNAQNTANHIFVYLDAESQCDLLRDSGASPTRIPSFHLQDSIYQLSGRSLRAGTAPALARKQQAILSLD
jgi:hypothetical protein